MDLRNSELIECGVINFDAYISRHPNRNLEENLQTYMKEIKNGYLISLIGETRNDNTKRFIFSQLSPDADLTNLLPNPNPGDSDGINDNGQIDFLVGIMLGSEFLKRIKVADSLEERYKKFVMKKLSDIDL